MKIKVITKTASDLCWSFDSSEPFVALKEHGGYTTHEKVDPFPAYAANTELVNKCLSEVASIFPIDWPLTLYILPYEVIGRTNAFTQASSFDYSKKITDDESKEQYARAPFIVLSGKRIPIMPAMVRYLVAHEYGHVIEDWVAKKRGQKDTELLEEYAALRGMTFPNSYGGNWHITPGEVFANDFRILIAKAEIEFWPHNVCRPEDSPAAIEWWNKAKDLIGT